MRLTCLFAVLYYTTACLYAQHDNKIVCVAQVKKDSIVLRWVPTSIPVWQMGVKYGYTVERFTISKGGQFTPDGLTQGNLLTSVPVRPAINEVFDEIIKKDSGAAIVQEAIYGTDFQPLMPENNFQSFMKSYNDLEVRFGFALFMCDLSPVTAQAAGLRFTDRDVVPDERYAYRISLVNVPDGMTVDPAVIVLDAASFTKLPQVTDFMSIFMDKAVKLQWPVMLYKGIFTAYILEKSIDGINYKTVSDLPLINASENENQDFFVYTDSLKHNEEQTWYRVKGISPFGEEGPASEAVKGMGRPEFLAYGTIDSAKVIENKKIIIHWRVTESKDAPVTGYQVIRASNPNGMYELLTPKPLQSAVRFFTDNKPGISNYYKIVLLGKDNRKSESFPYLVQTEDNDPPSPPQMLTGKVDSSGSVTIFWKANIEPDISGYNVFRANAPFEEFMAITREITPDNQYCDTINLNTLTQKIYYKVVAVDKHYNNSEYSAALELSRPDTIAPAPAVILTANVKADKVNLRFEKSPSDDVDRYELYTHYEEDSVLVKIAEWTKTLPLVYEDLTGKKSGNWLYVLKTMDLSQNVSAFSRKVIIVNFIKSTINLKAVEGKDGKRINVYWDLPESKIPVKTMIYRSESSDSTSIYKTLEGHITSYEDTDIEIGTIYYYRIRILLTTGEVLISVIPVSQSKNSN